MIHDSERRTLAELADFTRWLHASSEHAPIASTATIAAGICLYVKLPPNRQRLSPPAIDAPTVAVNGARKKMGTT